MTEQPQPTFPPPGAAPVLRVGVLGSGTVGTQVVRLLLEQADDFAARSGARMEITGIAVRNLDAPRDPAVPRELLTDDATAVATGNDLVVELIGGIEPARTLILAAFKAGASVITGNKALIAAHGPELYDAAAAAGTDFYYEAAVAGAVPVVYALRESMAGDRVTSVLGIVNGTTNYILDEMSTKGLSFDEVLATAQALGYAEADPTADVDGLDAAAKAAIIASLAFHTRVGLSDVQVEGIRSVTADDIREAHASGCELKLLAIAQRREDEHAHGVSVRVHPALVPADHPLASVHGAYNAVLVEAESAGRLMFYGQGAGGAPTASAARPPASPPTRACRSWGRRRPSPDTRSSCALRMPRDPWRPWPASSPTTRCPSTRCVRAPMSPVMGRPWSPSSPTPPPSSTSMPPSRACGPRTGSWRSSPSGASRGSEHALGE